MILKVSGTEAESVVHKIGSFVESGAALMKAATKWVGLAADAIDKRLPQTDEEIERDIKLSEIELSLRERRARIEMMELDAREKKAVAEKMEADNRIRAASINSRKLSNSTHKLNTQPNKAPQAHPQKARPAPIRQLPVLSEVESNAQNAVVPPVESSERRSDVRGSKEGQSLTFTIGEKLKPSNPS